jgi:hypothetical protein
MRLQGCGNEDMPSGGEHKRLASFFWPAAGHSLGGDGRSPWARRWGDLGVIESLEAAGGFKRDFERISPAGEALE